MKLCEGYIPLHSIKNNIFTTIFHHKAENLVIERVSFTTDNGNFMKQKEKIARSRQKRQKIAIPTYGKLLPLP